MRKSSRLSKAESEGVGSSVVGSPVPQQSRITEYVNVKKRGNYSTSTVTVAEQAKQVLFKDSNEMESFPGTPVKIKRKPGAKGAVVKLGILTPSPSVESVNDLKTELSNPDNAKDMIESNVSAENIGTTEIAKNILTTVPTVKTAPAYKRFAHLVEGVRNQKPKLEEPTVAESPVIISSASAAKPFKAVPWLPLNEKWAFYEKLIFNVDSLCVLAAGRSQPCVFHKIQKTLENVLDKQVPIEQMERLKTLWPEAYEYRENRIVMQGRRIESVAISVPGIGDAESSAALLNERREEVKGRVQKHLIGAHNSELLLEDKEAIPRQWSDKFKQDTVKDLDRTPLIGTIAATEVTDYSGFSIPVRPGTPKLIAGIIQSSSPIVPSTPISGIASAVAITPDAPVKLSLLERIRAKEQAMEARKCFKGDDNPETARLTAILSQMERFTQSVMFTFSSSKKTSLFLTDLTTKLVQSSKVPLSQPEVLERLKLLERAAPEWIKIVDDVNVEGGPKHVKILQKNRSMQSVLEALNTSKTFKNGN